MSGLRLSNLLVKRFSTPEEKASFCEKYMESEPVLKAIVDVIDEKICANRASQLSLKEYDSPAWPYQQADHNAYQRALEEIKRLLTAERVSDNDR